MEYSDIKYALVYFISDKDFSIYPISEVIGFNEDNFKMLALGGKLFLEAEYDCILEKVIYYFYFSFRYIYYTYMYYEHAIVSIEIKELVYLF